MPYRFLTYDVFTDSAFGGNPLAVFPNGQGLDDVAMQRIAREFNLSETVFIFPPQQAGNAARLRIFTPARELPFAGHPTVGAALHLARTGVLGPLADGDARVLEEQAGLVTVQFSVREGVVVSARLAAPQAPSFIDCTVTDQALASVLSLSADEIGAGDWRPRFVSCGNPFLLIPLRDLSALSSSQIDVDAWRRVLEGAPSGALFPFVRLADGTLRARMYSPSFGIGEDPATGSAAVCLAGYLAAHAPQADGSLDWTLHQGVEMGRPSELLIAADKAAGQVTRCYVAGSAVLISQGEFLAA